MKISNSKKKRDQILLIIVCMAVMIALTVACIIYFRKQVSLIPRNTGESVEYNHHYAFICEDPKDEFYNAIFDSADRTAKMNKDYLEFMGRNLEISYSKYDLMKIAIDAKVDGIIVEADESTTMTGLIDEANRNGIPVITVGTDDTSSRRKSYVGFGYYELGQNYGKQILRNISDKTQEILVLMSPETNGAGQNIIYQGIKDTIDKSDATKNLHLNTMVIQNNSKFGAEEKISSMMMDDTELPSMIVCLNEIDTTCACQALVDYNRVGDTTVYGFYTNSTILSAIQKNIITATVTVNTSQMGKYCVEALEEYEKYGNVNEYMPADTEVVTSANVESYIKNLDSEAENEEK